MTFLWCVGILGYTALMLCLGAFAGFVYFGRGQWTYFLHRVIPVRPNEYLEGFMKELVDEGTLTSKQAVAFSDKLWTEELRRDRRERWEEAQREADYTSAARETAAGIEEVKRNLGI